MSKTPDKRTPGRPAHDFDKDIANKVARYARVGVPHKQIAIIVDVSENVLRRVYRRELDFASVEANVEIAGRLYSKAMDGDNASMIFWMKSRAGWSEKTTTNFISEDGSMSPPDEITVRIVSAGDV